MLLEIEVGGKLKKNEDKNRRQVDLELMEFQGCVSRFLSIVTLTVPLWSIT